MKNNNYFSAKNNLTGCGWCHGHNVESHDHLQKADLLRNINNKKGRTIQLLYNFRHKYVVIKLVLMHISKVGIIL